ncbi:MAG: hypothetical protein IPM15_11535 [Betaproteobacteria bacterium]|nr:hypothetical protein [Betaproteobacteria bacterium]
MSALLGGCSALRVAYNTGPQLAWWWLDGYADFAGEDAPKVKASIERWFEWHRPSQLPAYAALLAAAQAEADKPLTPELACQWYRRVVDLAAPALARALEHGADVVPLLGEAQLRHLEQRYAKNIDEMKAEYLQGDPAERRTAALKRAVTRAEQFYGRLDDTQRRLLAELLAASPADPQAWMDERRRRQRDNVQTLRRLVAERADRNERLAALRMLADRYQRSPDAAHRAYQQRLLDYNCALVARLHNAMTPAQRQRARATLRGYEDDLRAVLAGQAGVPDNGAVPGATN